MKKLILLGYVLPISIILTIGGYFVYLKFQAPESNLSYYELQLLLFKENWQIIIIALVAVIYMKFIVPKVFK